MATSEVEPVARLMNVVRASSEVMTLTDDGGKRHPAQLAARFNALASTRTTRLENS